MGISTEGNKTDIKDKGNKLNMKSFYSESLFSGNHEVIQRYYNQKLLDWITEKPLWDIKESKKLSKFELIKIEVKNIIFEIKQRFYYAYKAIIGQYDEFYN